MKTPAVVVAAFVSIFLIAMGVATSHYVSPEPALAQSLAYDSIESSSTSGGVVVELRLTISDLSTDMVRGTAVELYLEDDFQVPDSFSASSIYFAATNPTTNATNNGGSVLATGGSISDGDHFGGDDDWAIRIYVPDMNPGGTYDGPQAGQTLTMVITNAAGIKNPSEAGTHSVGYSVLGPNDAANAGPQVNLGGLATFAKISLSDVDNTRGYNLTIVGSGFNNRTTASVYVRHVAGDGSNRHLWDALNCAEMNVAVGSDDVEGSGYCRMYANLNAAEKATVDLLNFGWGPAEEALCSAIIRSGTNVGGAFVASDDKVVVTFAVTVPPFQGGDQNYICMVDGEGRASVTDVEQFHLLPSMRATPSTIAIGDTVTVFAQDYPVVGALFTELTLAGQTVWPSTNGAGTIDVQAAPIGTDHAANATFTMPSEVNGVALVGTIRIDASWGSIRKNTRITVTDTASSQPVSTPLAAPANFTATPGTQSGTVNLRWDAPANAQYHFVAWIPSGVTDLNRASILPVSAEGRVTITGLNPDTTYNFIVIAGRWEWSPDYGAKWSPWSDWVPATASP